MVRKDMTLSEYGRWRSQQRPEIERECVVCHEKFTARDSRALTCSPKCRKQRQREQQRAKNKEPPE